MERAYPSFSSRRANYSTLHIPCSKIHISDKFYLFFCTSHEALLARNTRFVADTREGGFFGTARL